MENSANDESESIESDDFFCEYDQEENSVENNQATRDEVVASNIDQLASSIEELASNIDELLLYSVPDQQPTSSLTSTRHDLHQVGFEYDDPIYQEFNHHETTFNGSSRDLLDTVGKLSDYEGKMKENDYLNICAQMKNIFESHNKMMNIVISINHRLKDKMLNYRNSLNESMDLNRKIAEEISDIRKQLWNDNRSHKTIFSITKLI